MFNLLSKIGCIGPENECLLEEYEYEVQEILGMSTMCDIYSFTLWNRMITNQMVKGKAVDEKNIQIRINQMRTYIIQATKEFSCIHSREKKLNTFATSSTEQQREILRNAGVSMKMS